MRFEREMLTLLGARDHDSNRAVDFGTFIRQAMAYLAPGDLASEETIACSRENRELILDDSLRFVEDDTDSRWTKEEPADDEIFW